MKQIRTWWILVILLVAGSVQAADIVNYTTMTNAVCQQTTETNSWQTCLDNWERGLHQLDVWSATTTAIGSYYMLTSTNAGFDSLQFRGDIIIGRCGQEHVNDYPKVSHTDKGVQKVRTYTRVIAIEGKEVETQWRIYSYPHEKITTTTTVKLVKQTSVSTNVVEVKEPHDCDLCGQVVK